MVLAMMMVRFFLVSTCGVVGLVSSVVIVVLSVSCVVGFSLSQNQGVFITLYGLCQVGCVAQW